MDTEYDWFLIFNKAEFEATGLVLRTINPVLESRGQPEIKITKGNTVAVTVDGAFLPVGFLDRNPYAQDTYAIYLDEATNDVYLGLEVEE